MFLVHFKMPNGTSVRSIKSVLPSGWRVEKSALDGKLWLVDSSNGNTIGSITRQPGKIVIEANEETSDAHWFWIAFALMYPDQNPFDLRYGVLYRLDGKMQLDEFPKRGHKGVLNDVSHYREISEAYYVSFRLGDWHYQSDVFLKSCRKINGDGSLGKDEGRLMFILGNTENENTM